MSKRTFTFLYILSPIIPICIYLSSIGWNGEPIRILSKIFGICAFALFCNQLILASRPAFIVKALGQKHITMLHSVMPAVIIVAAIVHRFLKAAAGYDVESTQADLGAAGLALMVLLSLLAFLLIANLSGKLGDSLRTFRARLTKRWNISYKGTRAVHAFTALAAPVLCVHMLLASSSDFSRNPVGALWLAIYALVSLYLFINYRASGRMPRKEKK